MDFGVGEFESLCVHKKKILRSLIRELRLPSIDSSNRRKTF
nr:MAG TPA: hypothetical protein [Crassvirales sp.]